MSRPRLSAIPPPNDEPSARAAVRACKEILDFFLGRTRNQPLGAAVMFQDLIDLGLITERQAREQIGRN